MIQFECHNCAYFNRRNCTIKNFPVFESNKACEHFSNILYNCIKCGTPLFHEQMYITPEGKTYCYSCWNKLNTCETCSNSHHCAFNDSTESPKFIQKKKNVNGFIIETQEMNSDIVAKTCQNGCLCYSEENNCCKQNNYCGNYQDKN